MGLVVYAAPLYHKLPYGLILLSLAVFNWQVFICVFVQRLSVLLVSYEIGRG